jgi:hypothetical protein
MLLFTLCPGITAVPALVFPASCWPSSSPAAWSGSAAAAPCHRHILCMTAPFAVVHLKALSFTLQVGSREEIVVVKACAAADATPGIPHRCSRPTGKCPGGSEAAKRPGDSAAAKWVSFAHPLASTPSLAAQPRNGPGTVFLPSAEVFERRDRWRCQRLHSSRIRRASGRRRGIRNPSGHCLKGWTSDPLYFQPRPELGGSPVETCFAWLHAYLCTRGYINAYVIEKKLVLS